MAVKIFFCYAREDEFLLNKLKTHLKPLQRQGLIDVWHDRDISAGTEWEPEITKHLNEAEIILLLVSPDFMNSDYCYGIEMKRALEKYEAGEAHVLPIILRPTLWKLTPFAGLTALPLDGKPVTSWLDMDEAWLNVTQGIYEAIFAKFKTNRSSFQLSRHDFAHTPLPHTDILKQPNEDDNYDDWTPALVDETFENVRLSLRLCGICRPYPGCEISGLRTKNYITVHRLTCSKLRDKGSIKLMWTYTSRRISCTLLITATDRVALMSDVLEILQGHECSVKEIVGQASNTEEAIFKIELFVNSYLSIDEVVRDLNHLRSVHAVNWENTSSPSHRAK